MDIHKPKPWHGVREFLKEYAIIVVGVLTALAAEQAVERLRWAHEVRLARAEMAREISANDGDFAYRVAAAPCISRRLDALESVIEKVARHEPVPNLGEVLPDIGNAYSDNIWQNYRAAQTLTHFETKEAELLGWYYLQLGTIRQFIATESEARAVLAELQGDPARLGPADIANLRVALQRARFDNALITGIAGVELDWSKTLHVAPAPPSAERLKDVCGPLPVIGAS